MELFEENKQEGLIKNQITMTEEMGEAKKDMAEALQDQT